jgi:DMSO/TMAO reductase YedYZ molybdopterin-dependent catalytic subunit
LDSNGFSKVATTIIVFVIVLALGGGIAYWYTIQTYPSVSEEQWVIVVDGLVEHPYNWPSKELRGLSAVTVNASLQCFGDKVPHYSEWTGVKLKPLLSSAGVKPSAIKIAFYAADGFSTDLPVEIVERDDIILAYQKDGVDLTDNRLVVPGKWGYKWIHTITHIELVDYDYQGTYECSGYSDEVDISAYK